LKHEAGSRTAAKPKWLEKSKPFFPYLENLGLLFLVILLSYLLKDALNLVDYRLFYIVMASFFFGRSQSVLSISLATVWYLSENVLNGMELISQLIDHNTVVHIGLYIFTGLVTSYILDKKEKLIQSSQVEVETMKERYESLVSVLKDTMTVKNELQEQVLYTNNSIATVYKVVKELDSLQAEKIYSASIGIMEDIMKANGASIYLLDPSKKKLRLEAKSKGLDLQDSLVLSESEMLTEVLKTCTVQVNKQLDPKQPAMAAPISIGGHDAGVICLYDPEFEYLTLAYQNQLSVLTELISSALSRAIKYEQAAAGKNNRKTRYFGNKEEAYV